MLGHLRPQRTAKLQIFTCWSLSTLTVGAVCGLKRYDLLRLTGVSRTPTGWDVGSTRLRAIPGLPLWSLDFVVGRLGILRLHEEALISAPIGGASSIGSGTHDDFNDEASALHSEQTLCSNPAMSNVHTVIYSLFTISYRLSERTVLFVP